MIFSAIVLSVLGLGVTQALSYDPTCSDNLAVYWGQNSYGVANPNDSSNWQQTISNYCQDTVIDVIPIAFVNVYFSTGGLPQLDLSNICGTSTGVFAGTDLANCQFLAAGIQTCQAMGKLITISIGKRESLSYEFILNWTAFANTIWTVSRWLELYASLRFGVLDGVDLDIEIGIPLATPLLISQYIFFSYYVTAAPQCPFPDAHIGSALNAASFDAVYVSEVSNEANPSDWDYSTWDNWAKTVSLNPNVKVFIGAPASPSAGGGYVDASTLVQLRSTRAQYSSFGGIMLWDASQAYANGRFDEQIKNIIAADDTCAAIESKTGVSDAQLHTLNPAINSGCTNLQVGQTLCVVASTGCTQTYTVVSGDTNQQRMYKSECRSNALPQRGWWRCTQKYTVVSGDTCAAIESKTGVSDAQLHALNPAINSGCTNLSVGQTLCLSGSSGGCTQKYTVVSGDTGCTNLSVGQTLCV
ncbi:glycoside hydrolase superfamily [Mycena galopus ATCC 62051]|nr:glycoside hydrolase superfamily [Mycena galopus ATCC 62051]